VIAARQAQADRDDDRAHDRQPIRERHADTGSGALEAAAAKQQSVTAPPPPPAPLDPELQAASGERQNPELAEAPSERAAIMAPETPRSAAAMPAPSNLHS